MNHPREPQLKAGARIILFMIAMIVILMAVKVLLPKIKYSLGVNEMYINSSY